MSIILWVVKKTRVNVTENLCQPKTIWYEPMITLIGTGHIFNLSSALYNIFDTNPPDIVCVELDTQRYHGLVYKKAHPDDYQQKQQNLPLIYRVLARFQDNMANEFGVIAGDEMLSAITYAQTHQIPYECIDMNAQQLFTGMWKTMPFFEKSRLLLSGIGGLCVSKKRVEKEINKLQDNVEIYMDQIEKNFPTIKHTLIDTRNKYMTDQIIRLHHNYSTIVACVGDGHITGMAKLLAEQEIPCETVRLKELQKISAIPQDAATASFSTQYSSQEFSE